MASETSPLLYENPYTIQQLMGYVFMGLCSIYGIISIVAIVIASTLYNMDCEGSVQLLLLLESTTSILIILYIYNWYYKWTNIYCGTIVFIFMIALSFSYIMIGMIIVWPYTTTFACPNLLYYFAFTYFNMWWMATIFGIFVFGIVCIIFRNKISHI